MPALDWIFVLIMASSLLLGAWRGLVFEVLSMSGWVVAFVLAQWWAAEVGGWLPMNTHNETLRYAVGYAVVLVLSVFAFGLLAALARRTLAAAGLRPADRVFGGGFGLLRGLMLLLLVTAGLQRMQLTGSAWWQESHGGHWLEQGLVVARPLLPEGIAKFLTP